MLSGGDLLFLNRFSGRVCGFVVVGVGVIERRSERTSDSTLDRERIERLHDPRVGTAASSEEDVGLAIEHHQDGNPWHGARAFVVTQVHGHSHATHRAALQIEDGDVGRSGHDDIGDIATIATHGETGFWPAQSGDDFVDDPLGVGCDQDMHKKNLAARRPNVEEMPRDLSKSAQIVHIVGQQWHPMNGSVAGVCDEWSDDSFFGIGKGA